MASKRSQAQFDSDMESGTGDTSPSTISSWTNTSPRKVRTEHVVGRPREETTPRRQSSLSALSSKLGGRVKSWFPSRNQPVSTMTPTDSVGASGEQTRNLRSVAHRGVILDNSPFSPFIPDGLSPDQVLVYETLIKVVKDRGDSDGPRVVPITDLAKDYDDLAAMVVLKELHRLRVIKLVGFVANLMPSHRRALFGRGALDSLQLTDIPIAKGTTGYPKIAYQGKVGAKQHQELPHEFRGMEEFPALEPENKMLSDDGEGEKLLLKLFSEAAMTGKKLTLLLISSLEDIFTFSQNHPDKLQEGLKNVILQGGYALNEEGTLVPAQDANNNRYDMYAAEKFHQFLQEKSIPSVVYTKVAAFATPLYTDLFAELEATGHPLGKHLRMVQVEQDLAFYSSACRKDPKMRFADYMDQKWYLTNKTSWFDNLDEKSPLYLSPTDPLYHAPDAPYPKGAQVIPYLTKVVVYDALAALGSCGDDALEALGILTTNAAHSPSIHKVVGSVGPPLDTGINPEEMATALSALLKGSLLASQQAKQ